jgi:aldehyde oxidoreductase
MHSQQGKRMITFILNNSVQRYDGKPEDSLLQHLRQEQRITSAKDGCSGEGVCGACTVEVDGKPRLACRTKMGDVDGASVVTTEGLPDSFRKLIGNMFAEKGAVQCGFCSPGFIMRSRQLFERPDRPSRRDIIKAVSPNLCRCTGYVKIVDAIEAALAQHESPAKSTIPGSARIGEAYVKYNAVDTALGNRPFVADLFFEGLLHAALKFSDHPRARIKKIDASAAGKLPGVVRVFTAADIPGKQLTGLIFPDWPLMIGTGQLTHCVGDVLAGVVADTEAIARQAVELIKIEYEVMDPVIDMHEAARPGSEQVHHGRSNVLESCSIRFGDVSGAFEDAAFVASHVFETQRIEHAFLETETAVALPEGEGVHLYSQGQGVYVDRRLVAEILGLEEEKVRVTQVQNGGGFGGKEDLSVQGHACLFAYILGKPVRVHLNRSESVRMHPKRHPVWMDMQLACDKSGKLTALRLKAIGDTGAYASVGTKVMERVVGHATGGYVIPSVDIEALTVYTNNIPSGAMRGFGVPQVVFAVEGCLEDLCKKGGFDRWQMRFDNALEDGATTATGQRLQGVGLKKTLLAVKDAFREARYAGIACGLKNTGVGNGMVDDSEAIIEVRSAEKIIIHHGWTEMGQGVHTMAIQVLHEETGLDPALMEVIVDTAAGIPTGMTTSSRATALLGNAIIDAARRLKDDLSQTDLNQLSGRKYKGKYVCDWTSKPGADTDNPMIHFAYGYATQLVILDKEGRIKKVVAAHDAGRIMNQMLFEGQIEGAVHMGLGYAVSENLPLKGGMPVSLKMKDFGILRAREMPEIEVIGIEEPDSFGPYGAKGIGEIGMVPTAAAVAGAYHIYDGLLRLQLPLSKPVKQDDN